MKKRETTQTVNKEDKPVTMIEIPQVKEQGLFIGKVHLGGKIFYIDASGKHGLIAAEEDLSITLPFQTNLPFISSGAYSTDIGSGKANTNAIINKLGEGNYAARACVDLELNGFNDWFLPSRDELELLHKNKDTVGNFANDFYWSSSEYVDYIFYAWDQPFNSGNQAYGTNKTTKRRVRAVRAF